MNPRATEYRNFPRPGTARLATVAKLSPTEGDILGPFYKANAPWRIILVDYPDLILLETTKPGYYDISEPGDPEPHEFRCSHIHAMMTAPGFNRHKVSGPGIKGEIKVALLTQLYFADSKYDDTDRWFDKRRCVNPTETPSHVTFDFVLERE